MNADRLTDTELLARLACYRWELPARWCDLLGELIHRYAARAEAIQALQTRVLDLTAETNVLTQENRFLQELQQ